MRQKLAYYQDDGFLFAVQVASAKNLSERFPIYINQMNLLGLLLGCLDSIFLKQLHYSNSKKEKMQLIYVKDKMN